MKIKNVRFVVLGQTCSGSTDGVQLFFKQEHEALLEQYTYIEASNKDIADDEITDSEGEIQHELVCEFLSKVFHSQK